MELEKWEPATLSKNRINNGMPLEQLKGIPMARRRYQRGMLMLRGKKRPVWVGRWREDVKLSDGTTKRIQKSVVLGDQMDFPTKKLAQRALDEKLASVNLPTYKVRHRMTFEEFATRWKATSMTTFKPSTVNSVSGHINKWLIPHFGDMVMNEITPQDVQLFLLKLPLSPKTVRNVVSTIRMIWKTARQWGLTETKVLDGVRCPRLLPPHQPRFTVEQTKQIVATANEPAKTIFYLAAETGARSGELLGLRRKDLDLENRRIRIRQAVWNGKISTPKTPSAIREMAVSVYLAEHLAKFLKEHFHENENDLLFTTRNGKPLDARFLLRDNLHKVLEKLGIEVPGRIGLHAFRHTNASLMDQQRIPLRVRTDRLGHSDPNTTIKIYTHQLDREADLALADQLGEILLPPRNMSLSTEEATPCIQSADTLEFVPEYLGA